MVSFLAKYTAIIFTLSLMYLSPLQAKDTISLMVKLDDIVKVKSQEESGDELYFNITEYSSIDAARHYQVPPFPTHWLSAYLDKVKDVTLWERQLRAGEGIELIISLVERDVPPWNVDDLLGSVKLKLKWENNQLQKEWSIPNQANTQKLEGNVNQFLLTGDGGEYRIQLKVLEVDDVLTSSSLPPSVPQSIPTSITSDMD